MDAGRAANICSTFVAVAALFVAANAVQGENGHRVSRSDVRAVLGEKMDPNFWPTRGRRSPLGAALGSEEDDAPFWANRGRSVRLGEEDEAPFWANRGRSVRLGELQSLLQERGVGSDEEPPFWANRGRSLPCDGIGQDGALFAEEPYWVMMDRRDDETAGGSSLVDPFWVARGRRGLLDTLGTAPNDFWASRGKKAPLATRQGENAARALGLSSDQFWPARGKRAADSRGKRAAAARTRLNDKPHHHV
ncbi:uncharacterized protein LOC111049979 isoform X1 [Nilaparvata lugens]|uniref:uncharacterized protein LOC111049979 isoform X1 n=1 Tax=Nilaparvata lugens TaxID=108931 RepID=UPI000B9908E9|nr:uncharacterized protein LOC111049979 isoform X1 [Nilaparvata lugens]